MAQVSFKLVDACINIPFTGFMKEKWNSWMQSTDIEMTP